MFRLSVSKYLKILSFLSKTSWIIHTYIYMHNVYGFWLFQDAKLNSYFTSIAWILYTCICICVCISIRISHIYMYVHVHVLKFPRHKSLGLFSMPAFLFERIHHAGSWDTHHRMQRYIHNIGHDLPLSSGGTNGMRHPK